MELIDGLSGPSRLAAVTWIELEGHPADLDLVARLESLCAQRLQHADAPQPALDVRHRVGVLDVEAREQTLDPRAANRERALARALDRESRVRARAEDHVLRERFARGRLRGGA